MTDNAFFMVTINLMFLLGLYELANFAAIQWACGLPAQIVEGADARRGQRWSRRDAFGWSFARSSK